MGISRRFLSNLRAGFRFAPEIAGAWEKRYFEKFSVLLRLSVRTAMKTYSSGLGRISVLSKVEGPMMKTQDCQIHSLQRIPEGYAELDPQPLRIHLKLAFSRHLSPRARKMIKVRSNNLLNWFSKVDENIFFWYKRSFTEPKTRHEYL